MLAGGSLLDEEEDVFAGLTPEVGAEVAFLKTPEVGAVLHGPAPKMIVAAGAPGVLLCMAARCRPPWKWALVPCAGGRSVGLVAADMLLLLLPLLLGLLLHALGGCRRSRPTWRRPPVPSRPTPLRA